jgi:hypothetical protein
MRIHKKHTYLSTLLLHACFVTGVVASDMPSNTLFDAALLKEKFSGVESYESNGCQLIVAPEVFESPALPKRIGKVLQTFETYAVEETENKLDRALVPASDAVKLEWLEKLNFLHAVISSALIASTLSDEHILTSSGETIILNYVTRNDLIGSRSLRESLMKFGYLSQTKLHVVYTEFLQRLTDPDYRDKLVTTDVYRPLKKWMEDNLPLSQMCKFVEVSYEEDKRYPGAKYLIEFSKRLFRRNLEKDPRVLSLNLPEQRDGVLVTKLADAADNLILKYQSSPELNQHVPALMRFVLSEPTVEGELNKAIQQVRDAREKAHEQSQARVAARKAAQATVVVTQEMLDERAAALKELGLDDDAMPSPSGKTKQAKQKAGAESEPKEAGKQQAKPAQVLKGKVAEVTPTKMSEPNVDLAQKAKEEQERLERAEEDARERAERKEKTAQRQQALRDKRDRELEEASRQVEVLHQRKAARVEEMFSMYRGLSTKASVSISIFNGEPDLDDVIKALEAAGVSVLMHVHGNEKCLAMWQSANGEKHMVWFDAPHGAQLTKGSKAGWVRALRSNLEKAGMLQAE